MDFCLTEDQKKLVETVRTFGERHFAFERVLQWRADGGLPDEVVCDFVNLDFNGYGIIHRVDHERYDLFAQVLVLEELARISGATLPFSNDFLNLQIMEEFADSDECSFVRVRYQDEGRIAFALAISEPGSGSDVMGMGTSTCTVDGKLVLTGRKMFVNNGEYAPYLLVAAVDKDAPKGKYPALSLWLIPRNLPGIEVYPIEKVGQSILPFSRMAFDGVELEESYRLHGKRSGFPQLFHFFEIGRLFSCATALGLAQAAMEDAASFARERRAFGQAIASFEMIQQMLVDMEVKLENMRGLVYKAADLLDGGAPDHAARLAISLMKRYVPAAATEVASDAMQILGGRGYTRSERVPSIWQDCRGFQIAEGTDQIMVRIAAPLVLEKYERGAGGNAGRGLH